jgi:hypothetical protein
MNREAGVCGADDEASHVLKVAQWRRSLPARSSTGRGQEQDRQSLDPAAEPSAGEAIEEYHEAKDRGEQRLHQPSIQSSRESSIPDSA